MKKILSLVVASILTLSACDNKKEEITNEKPTIKIGATLPLTGNAAEAGQAAKAGLEMTLKKLNRTSNKYNYELVFEDNQMIPQKVAITTNKMINMDKVSAVLSFWGLMGNIVADIANKNNIMSFSCTFGDFSNSGKYGYNIAPIYEEQAKTMLEELKKRNIRTVALFVDNTEITDQYNVLEKQIKEDSNIEIVFREQFQPGEKDYKMAIAKASAKTPDMYLISGYAPSPFLFMKQLKDITGRNDNVTSIDTFAEIFPQEIVAGLWYADSNQGGTDDFIEELKEYKSDITPSSCLGSMVASLEILVDAAENSETFNNDSINQWIIKNVQNYKTSTGILNADKNGKIKTPVTIKQIKNGKPVVIED